MSTWWVAAAADGHDTAAVLAAAVSTANAAIGLDGSLPILHVIQRCRMPVCGDVMGVTAFQLVYLPARLPACLLDCRLASVPVFLLVCLPPRALLTCLSCLFVVPVANTLPPPPPAPGLFKRAHNPNKSTKFWILPTPYS